MIVASWWAAVALAAAPSAVEVHRFARGFVSVVALEGPHGVVLVDTHFPRSTRWVRRQLDRAGLTDRISAIVLTHGHSDHAGGADRLRRELGVPVIVGAGDRPILEAGDHGPISSPSLWVRWGQALVPRRFPAVVPDRPIPEGATISLAPYGVAGVVRAVGGHTPGSVVVVLDDDRVFCGDLIRGGFVAPHRPTMHFVHDDALAARAALVDLVDAGATEIWPGHGQALSRADLIAWLDAHPDDRWAVMPPDRTPAPATPDAAPPP